MREVNIVVVGAGGTGGNLLKELGRFLQFYYEEQTRWRLVIIDGDKVEEKNAERQPFAVTDAMAFKASVIKEGLCTAYGLPENRIHAVTSYIEKTYDLQKVVSGAAYGSTEVILVGAVDNHRARQVMHNYFSITRNCLYIDSANEFDYGEIVIGIKKNGKEIAPPRGYYFPEVLTDDGPRASELSCGAINVSAPQHQITNLTAANHILASIINYMKYGKADGGMICFNAFTHFSRYDCWTEELQKEKEAREKAREKAGEAHE